MSKVFLDTSVLFSAIYSQQGAARELLRLAIREKVALYISPLVLEETERNIGKKAPEKLDTYRALMQVVPFTVAPDPSKEAVLAASAYTALKDAPIIAAARTVDPDYFVTYDRKDLLDKPEVAAQSGLTIVTPDVVVSILRGDDPERQVN
jgi:putative PIN family toxin of toxin-antitoxin system